MRHRLTHGREVIKMKIELNKDERRMIEIALRNAKDQMWEEAWKADKDERMEITEAIGYICELIEKIRKGV